MLSKSTRLYHRRRDEFIRSRGGRCEDCGSVDQLEIDHIDPTKKTMEAGDALMRRAEVRIPELSLCQVLCAKCHRDKTDAYTRANVTPRYCSIEGCTRAHEAHGLCGTHATRIKRGRNVTGVVRQYSRQSGMCRASGCRSKAICKGMCKPHYTREHRRQKAMVSN